MFPVFLILKDVLSQYPENEALHKTLRYGVDKPEFLALVPELTLNIEILQLTCYDLYYNLTLKDYL